jgi:hypothetical protein
VRSGHREASLIFVGIARCYGFRPRRTFSRSRPADGVWRRVTRDALWRPSLVAVEVIVTEGQKAVTLLEEVSLTRPCLR